MSTSEFESFHAAPHFIESGSWEKRQEKTVKKIALAFGFLLSENYHVRKSIDVNVDEFWRDLFSRS